MHAQQKQSILTLQFVKLLPLTTTETTAISLLADVFLILTACAGDDLIGPRDIKKGLHMLANANVKELEEEEEDEETEVDLEANRQKRIKKKDKTDTLTSEQMNQVRKKYANV